MGMFDKYLGVMTLGLAGDSPFKSLRTGATAAAKEAAAAGELQLSEQQAYQDTLAGAYDPTIQAGNQAFQSLSDYYSGNQQPMIDQAMSSPFYESMINQGESAIARNAQMTGGFRSGSTNENLAKNSQGVLQGLIDSQLQGQASIYNAGAGAQDAYSTAMQNSIAGVGATRGEISNIAINQAAQKQNLYSGLAGIAGSAAGSYMGAPKI